MNRTELASKVAAVRPAGRRSIDRDGCNGCCTVLARPDEWVDVVYKAAAVDCPAGRYDVLCWAAR
jgi:hypothetical protein